MYKLKVEKRSIKTYLQIIPITKLINNKAKLMPENQPAKIQSINPKTHVFLTENG